MKLIFKEYLDIFEKYPKDKYLTREERKERYKLLQEYEKRNYQDEISTDEFKDFISSYIDKIDVSSQFIGKFLKVINKKECKGYAIIFRNRPSLIFFLLRFFSLAYCYYFCKLKGTGLQKFRDFKSSDLGSTCTNHDFLDFPILRKKGQHSGITVYDLSLWYFYRQHIFIFST